MNIVHSRRTVVATALTLLAITAQASTYTSAPNGNGISAFAIPNTTTYGEIITAPSNSGKLESFSFWLEGSVAQAFGGVGTWTGSGVGTNLFTSSTFGASYGGFTEVTVNTGGIALTPGQNYVLYFSNGISGNSGYDTFEMGSGSSLDSGRGMAWDNNNGGSPVNGDWNGSHGGSYNLAYKAVFAVPEPTSFAMMGLGLLGFAIARRRKA